MSNAVVYGKAAPLQVAGQLSKGYFFQNLGTSPIYVGYDTGVNSGYFDGVIQPGGTYTSGSGRAVWLYSDTDTPVVYNDDSGANANAGTNVTASIPGTLATTVQNPVALASGTAVGVSGSVALASGTAVAVSGTAKVDATGSTVDASGSAVNATAQQSYTTLVNGAAISLGVGGGVTVQNNVNVGNARALVINYTAAAGNASALTDYMRVALQWLSPSGIQIYENFIGWAGAKLNIIVPAKGPRVSIILNASVKNTGVMTGTLDIQSTTLDVPEYYYASPSGISSSAFPISSSNVAINLNGTDLTNGATGQLTVTGTAVGSCSALYTIPAMAGRITGTFGGGGGGYNGDTARISLYHVTWGQIANSVASYTAGPALISTARLAGPDAAPVLFEFETARSPLLLYMSLFNSTAANAVVANATFTYERY